jgi:transketolase
MNTVKGKGLSFAENVVSYHNGMLSKENYDKAMAELS